MLELATERPRFGYPRLHILLGREGFLVTREERLQVRRERR